ncbi:MAG: hypothetical protein QNJ41_17180 [Xenococcaceae cyanobacterium MO_188.B32]|nr:hypothetical protein [Xenococcaceae cyanobacterium MO_188.B32]
MGETPKTALTHHRPDLKQFIFDLIVTGDGNIPIFLEAASGNQNDKKAFGHIAKNYYRQLKLETTIVGDSALYSKANLELEFTNSEISGYSWVEKESNYGGIRQRWLVVKSEARRESDLTSLEKKIGKEYQSTQKKITKLSQQKFKSDTEAELNLKLIQAKLKFHVIDKVQITENQEQTYQITGVIQANPDVIEKLAALLPIPIKYESRRRPNQRLLILPKLNVKCLWFPVLKKWLKINQSPQKIAYVAMDRTRWKQRNLFVASLIKDKRGIPLHWLLLDKKGNSNFREQKRLLKSVLRLLDGYQIVILGEREFGHISLADWLERQGCQYVLIPKDDKYIKQTGENYQLLKSLGLKPGKSFYLPSVELTKQKGFGVVNFNL